MIQVQLITDYSRKTLRELAARLDGSRTLEELVYREAELGEVWSLIDGDLRTTLWQAARTAAGDGLAALQRVICEVHNLVTARTDGSAAATRLRQAMLDNAGMQPAAAAQRMVP